MRRSHGRDVSNFTKDQGHSLLLKGSENDKGQMTNEQNKLNYSQFPTLTPISNHAQQSGVSHSLARRSRATD